MSKETDNTHAEINLVVQVFINFLVPLLILYALQKSESIEHVTEFEELYKQWLIAASVTPFIPGAIKGLIGSIVMSASSEKNLEPIYRLISAILLASITLFASYTNNENGLLLKTVASEYPEWLEPVLSGFLALLPAIYFTGSSLRKKK